MPECWRPLHAQQGGRGESEHDRSITPGQSMERAGGAIAAGAAMAGTAVRLNAREGLAGADADAESKEEGMVLSANALSQLEVLAAGKQSLVSPKA